MQGHLGTVLKGKEWLFGLVGLSFHKACARAAKTRTKGGVVNTVGHHKTTAVKQNMHIGTVFVSCTKEKENSYNQLLPPAQGKLSQLLTHPFFAQ